MSTGAVGRTASGEPWLFRLRSLLLKFDNKGGWLPLIPPEDIDERGNEGREVALTELSTAIADGLELNVTFLLVLFGKSGVGEGLELVGLIRGVLSVAVRELVEAIVSADSLQCAII